MNKSWYEEVLAVDLDKAGISFVREYRFSPDRKFRFDFAIPERMIAIEVEGGIWSGGRHTTPQGFLRDIVKYNLAVCSGWKVLRFTSDMVEAYIPVPMVLALLGEERDASQTTQEAKTSASPDGEAEGSRPKGRREALQEGPSQADRSGEGLSEEGEGAAPGDLQGPSQDQQRSP